MNRQDHITTIIKLLTRLPRAVESSNLLNLTDINNFSEDFYASLLNLIYGYELENANKAVSNAPAIDLRDSKKRIAYQVTSTSSFDKTQTTVNKFIEHELYLDYDRLIILNIVKKSNHRKNTIGSNVFSINSKKDVQDIDDLLKDIMHKTDPVLIKEIHDFLVNELHDKPRTTLPNEVQTILGIIEYISGETRPDVENDLIEDPDPDKKILQRFSDHAEYLINRYSDLFIEYGQILKTITNENDFGSQELRRAGTYLKGFSNDLLKKNQGDPKAALEALVDNFKIQLSGNGFSFDSGAAEFYVVDQLITCNVFPNRKIINA